MDFSAKKIDLKNHHITMSDFVLACTEVTPAFGIDTDKLDNLVRDPLMNYGNRFTKM